MNIDFALVNRALENIGMKPLFLEYPDDQTVICRDREDNTVTWQTARNYYLQTMLEALAQVEWTSAKRRRNLAPARMVHTRNKTFKYAYELPIDCAKAIELGGKEYFEIEANVLYTDVEPACLLYVSNGKRLVLHGEVTAGNGTRPYTQEYFSGGDGKRHRRYEWEDLVLCGGDGERPEEGSLPPNAEGEDFPEYRALKLEPNFYLYWEYLLSSKYALRLTDTPELSVMYFNKAQAIGRAAAGITAEQAAGRRTPADSWQEELGLS